MRFLTRLGVVLATGFGLISVAAPAAAQLGPGANLGAQDTSIQAGSVSTATDTVSATTSIGGIRQWQFSLSNFGTTQAGTAGIAVHSSGPALNDPTQFGFTASVGGPFTGQPTPPTPVPCVPPTSTDESCGPADVPANGGQLMVTTGNAPPGQPQPGIPTNFMPGFDSQRQGTIGGTWTVPVTLKDRFPQGGDIWVNLRGNFLPGTGQVTANGLPVPACTPGTFNPATCSESQFQPGGPGSCGGGGAWFLAAHTAKNNTTYSFSATQAACASGKPVVEIAATNFSPPSSPTVGDSVTIPDPNLGTIRYSVNPAAAGNPPNSFNTATTDQVQLRYEGVAPACPPDCLMGGNLQAQDTSIQAGSVSTSTDTVSSTTPVTGLRQWQFGLGNPGAGPVKGATIAVHSSGPALNDPSQFGFSAIVGQPFTGQPMPPTPVPCAPPTSTDESCGPADLPANGGQLMVFTGSAPPGQPRPGIPTTFMPGFDSQRQGTIGGTWTVPVTLKDRFPQGGDIWVNLRGDFLAGTGQVMANGQPVPACTPGSFNAGTCAESQFGPGGPGACGGNWFLAVHGAQQNTTYSFGAQQAACASGKPGVQVSANSFSPPGPPTVADSVTIPDPNLGTIRYAVNPAAAGSPPNSFNTGTSDQVQLEYQGAAPTCPPNCPPPPPPPPPPPSPPLPFTGGRGQHHPVDPARILDTREGGNAAPFKSTHGMSPGKLGPGSTLDVQILGRGGVPLTGVSAVIVNVTVTSPTASGYLVVYPKGSGRPLASNLNWTSGQTVANLVTVPVGADGKVSIFNSAGSTDVIFDIAAYVSTSAQSVGSAGLYNPLLPARLLDTRSGLGGATTVGAGGIVSLQVTGRGNVPTTGVSAVVLNVTATRPMAGSYVTVWPDGMDRPVASNLNFVAGQTVPNRVLVKVGASGKVDLYNFAGTVDLVVDVGGYFTDSSSNGGAGGFAPLTPTRLVDTRDGTGGVHSPVGPGGGGVLEVLVAGQKGVPAMSSATAPRAVALNVTATNPTAAGYLTLWPDGSALPLASDLNFTRGQTVANLVVVQVGADGRVDVYNLAGSTDVVIDVVGWFG